MPENMYDDGPAQMPPPTGAGSDAHASEAPGQPSALIPKALLAGKEFNVGDEVVLKITGMHGDSVQVEYAPEKGKGEEEEYEGDKESEAPPEEQQQPPPDQGGAGNVGGGDSMASMMG
jgi:hypothetical protein